MTILDLEYGRPDVLTAERLLLGGLSRARSAGERTVKLIHGYGSHGVGGRIRVEVRAYLERQRSRGLVRDVIPGERFSIFDEATRRAFLRCDELRRDADLDRANNGVTIVVL